MPIQKQMKAKGAIFGRTNLVRAYIINGVLMIRVFADNIMIQPEGLAFQTHQVVPRLKINMLRHDQSQNFSMDLFFPSSLACNIKRGTRARKSIKAVGNGGHEATSSIPLRTDRAGGLKLI